MTQTASAPVPLAAHGADPLTGRFTTPGDKAISHRALIIGALAVGRTTIEGLLEADDVLATAAALRQLGVGIERGEAAWLVDGLGVNGLLEPREPLNLGNSGTGARLLMGLLAAYPFATRVEGGPTLERRPMRPLLDALEPVGVSVEPAGGEGLPLTLRGSRWPLPVSQTLAVADDQIKSALLLAGLHVAATTTLVEPGPSRDHTENLLSAFGADISSVTGPDGKITITLAGLPELKPRHVVVPGDPSSAAYAIVAALCVPGSDLLVENVLINPTRTGLIDTLLQMGGDISFLNQHESGGEHVADLRVRSSRMKGVHVDAAHAAAMLDDIPALAVAAAFAQGETRIEGLAALRVQECDRLAAAFDGLVANQVDAKQPGDALIIAGGGRVEGGGLVESRGDHRIAMSFLVLGLGSRHKVTLDDTAPIGASFPGFVATMTELGARFEQVKGKP